MDLREVASLLGLSREAARMAIDDGIRTPSGQLVQLRAATLPTGPDVTETDLDAFIRYFENDEPGRHPPVAIRRDLLIEAGYRCAVCRLDGPLEFHHIVEWAAIKHHDAQHMLTVCANCHAKITRHGQPDTIAQKQIKQRLRREHDSAVQVNAQSAAMPAPAPQANATRTIQAPPPKRPASSGPRVVAPQRSAPVAVDPAAMRQIFAQEVSYQGPDDEALDWISQRLFSSQWDAQLSRDVVVLLRSLRAITEIQASVSPGLVWTMWAYTKRLLEVTANVLAEIEDDPLSGTDLAKAALAEARQRNLLQFEDVDEWHPGMASGSGWVEKVTLSRIGDKVLKKLDQP